MPDPAAASFPHHGEADLAPDLAPDQGRLLTRAEVAHRIRMSERTVRRLGDAGLLEEIRTGERAIRITERSVEQHLAGRRVHHDGQMAGVA